LRTSLVLLVELLVLGDLLLELGEGGVEGWLLQDLGLLVGVDLASSYQFIEGLSGVLFEDVVDLGGVCLWGYGLDRSGFQSGTMGTYNLLVDIADAPNEYVSLCVYLWHNGIASMEETTN